MPTDSAPIIVSALFAPADLAWLDGLRRAHFPPERNQLSAHLTLFHHLPPSAADELRQRLSTLTRSAVSPAARAAALMSLGNGVAIRIASPALEEVRAHIAEAFVGMLTPQDQAGWRPHVTIQNKVSAETARTLMRELGATFRERPVRIIGIGTYVYRGGPWEPLSRHMFAGG
ncbi:2'-5' RNA ligase family protein [Sphingomonas sp. BIUV-7]|uniref:2'-5' RNA ligase family protein n=1 Tax=Sphingomonas natans TaxID=3063330 RepID=A0ABT8Y625_9SPHN|nr:2'-5' RNA ligase family protein [Sphingomonas sp. BIUV-7]MDO6413770.1 2'-5' RNA ligase family protein [Sphingomonas sp. BIUV-7]